MSETTTVQSNADEAPELLAAEQIRTLFLFESLDQDKIDWLHREGRVEHRKQGEMVFVEGEPATCFYVLLDALNY